MTSVTTALFAVTVVANSPPGFAAQTPSTPRSAIMPTDRHRLSRQNDDDRHPGRSAERHVGRANGLQVCTASHVPMQTWFGYPPEDVSPVEASRSR